MSKIKTLFTLLREDRRKIGEAFIRNFSKTWLSHLIPDKAFLKLQYRFLIGKKLNLKNPQTFNEKLQWLKLYDRNPDYIKMVDKQEAKKYVAEKIGEQYIIPTLAVYDSINDIDIAALPEQFVLKCTHDSGSVCICRNKKDFDFEKAKSKLNSKMKSNLFWHGREWPYKKLKPRIIAEKYMTNSQSENLQDYKFFCFNGEPKIILVCSDRFSKIGLREDFFDVEWKHLDIRRPTHPNSDTEIVKPKNLDKMLLLAETLSKDIPFLRVDFYEVNGDIYFGELTFFPAAGFGPFTPETADKMLGEWINIQKG